MLAVLTSRGRSASVPPEARESSRRATGEQKACYPDSVSPIHIRPMDQADQAAVVCLAAKLGEWFNADGLREIATDLRYQPGFVAETDRQIVGFVVISVCEAKGRISWLGVQQDRQRLGIGRRLVGAVVSRMAGDGIKEVFVDTLAGRGRTRCEQENVASRQVEDTVD